MRRFQDAIDELLKWVEEDRKAREEDPVVLRMAVPWKSCKGSSSRHLLPPDFDLVKHGLCKWDWIDVTRSVVRDYERDFQKYGDLIQCKHCRLKFPLTIQTMVDQQERPLTFAATVDQRENKN